MLHQVEKVKTCAHLTDEVTELELQNRQLARKIAEEGIVLLENDGVLPVSPNTPIALYGTGITNTVKGGSGSGEVNERSSVTIYEGMRDAGYNIVNRAYLIDYRKKAAKARLEYEEYRYKQAGFMNMKSITMADMEEGYIDPPIGLLDEKDVYDASVCIFVISRMSGEGKDRTQTRGDYYLSDEEEHNLRWCGSHYNKLILIFNAGGPIDFSCIDDMEISAILNIGMLGEEGGTAVANVISGQISPSGHLTGSWPKHYEDIPGGETYSNLDGNSLSDDYREDIFVGYRYYERFGVKPRFWFGQGLSYTTFAMSATVSAKEKLEVQIQVKNTGNKSGKAVPQIYLSAPEGKLVQPETVLLAYEKTDLIEPGEETNLKLSIPYHYLASFDEERGLEIVEPGRYVLYLGKAVNDKEIIAGFDIEEEIVLIERKHICPMKKSIELIRPKQQKDMPFVDLKLLITVDPSNVKAEQIVSRLNPMDEYEERACEIVNTLSDEELALLLTGDGCSDMVMPIPHDTVVPGATGYSTSSLASKGLKCFACCDGPAGLRFMRTSVVKRGANKIRIVEPALDNLHFMPKAIRMMGNGKITDGQPLYMYATAFPTGTAVAQTWNQELVSSMGDAVATEMEDYGVTVWLAPGMNIHRNPLCGRNYEYYSEDPVLAGKTGAAMIRGIQKHRGCYATIKHFFCNNQENERRQTTANVSERALREIYLRGFGIVIKEAGGRALMSSYNRINGVWSGACHDSLTTVLREEWGFEGIVVTDWDASHEGLEAEKSIEAGITMLMAGDKQQRKAIISALQNGKLDRSLARERAAKNVEIILLHMELQNK